MYKVNIRGREVIAYDLYKNFYIVYYVDDYQGELVRRVTDEPVLDESGKPKKDRWGRPIKKVVVERVPLSQYVGEKVTYWYGFRPKDKTLPVNVMTYDYDRERKLWDAIDRFDDDLSGFACNITQLHGKRGKDAKYMKLKAAERFMRNEILAGKIKSYDRGEVRKK